VQHITIATVTTEQIQQYARSTTTKISEKFFDEKEKLPNDGSEDDGIHVDSREFPNSSLLGRNDTKDVLETIINAKNPLFISEHDSNDATVNQDELVPLKNTHKRLFSEIGDDLPSSHIMSVMEKYHAKSTMSKYESHSLFTDRKKVQTQVLVNAIYYEEIRSICDHLFGPLEASWIHDKWVKIRDLKVPEYNEGYLADLLCKIDQQEVVCELACGGPHKYDLTKWTSDKYQLPRMLKDTLDDILEKFRGVSRDSSNLYTIGIQLYMIEIRIYMMEKRDIYRFHLLKSFKLLLLYSSYDKLRLTLSWAWNIR
ncbi:5020_t:CDS:2, partial [Rhizophagus irregularis]